MDFTTIIFQFLNTYQSILLPFLALGLSNYVSRTFSTSFTIFSILMFMLFMVFNLPVYIYVAIAGIVLAFVLKYVGL